MATMPEEDRVAVWSEMMDELSTKRIESGFTKPELKAAVDAADQWVSDNQASFNTALPTEFKTSGTAEQKAMLLMYIITRRYLAGV